MYFGNWFFQKTYHIHEQILMGLKNQLLYFYYAKSLIMICQKQNYLHADYTFYWRLALLLPAEKLLV